jgi:hypothetical protein
MIPGDSVVMHHPEGFATLTGAGGGFVGWVPNGVPGVIYVLTPDKRRAVVHFAGKLIGTVPLEHLRVVHSSAASPAA